MAKIVLRVFIFLFSFIILSENLLASEHPEDSLLGSMGGSAAFLEIQKIVENNDKPHDPLGHINRISPFQQLYPLVVSETNKGQRQLCFPETEVYQQKEINVAIVIDAFRAFTTACYVLEQQPATYALTTKSTVVSRLASNLSNPLLIGKPEIGSDLAYDIPNSPTRVKGVNITGKNILHRTEAGAKGVLLAQGADVILAAGFVNADATVQYIKTLTNPKVHIVPMGHEAKTPSLEDDVCAQYINALLHDQKFNLTQFHTALRQGSGSYFFADDQWQYPCKDFNRCLKANRFSFAIQAEVRDDYAILKRCS